MTNKEKATFSIARFALISQFSGELVGATVLGLLVDHWLGSSPWGVIGIGFLGFAGAMIHLIKGVSAGGPSDNDLGQQNKDC